MSLTHLNCLTNQLTHLDVTQNINLKTFFLTGNYLTKLDLSKNSELLSLYGTSNLLTSLDVTQNPKLKYLSCGNNKLTSLEVTQNPELIVLNCGVNQITSLDVSGNPSLVSLACYNNRITSIDASENPNLEEFQCQNNELMSLNIKNGNNDILFEHPTSPHTYNEGFVATNNPALTCIQVDDETSANNGEFPYDNWNKDDIATYSEDCQAILGVDDEILTEGLNLYPNPVDYMLSIRSKLPLEKVEIYSILGQKIKEVNSDFNSISTDLLSNGIYMIRIYSEKGVTVRKLIKS